MFTPVKLDKDRRLMLGFGAMREFKAMTGKSMTKIDFENEEVEELLPTLIYCGLKWEDKELTLDETINLIDIHLGLKGTKELIVRAYKDAGFISDNPNA